MKQLDNGYIEKEEKIDKEKEKKKKKIDCCLVQREQLEVLKLPLNKETPFN